MNIKGQGHLLTMIKGHSHSTFSSFFFLETAWPVEAKFFVELPWDGGTKVCSTGPSHMTKMAAMPIYGKSLEKIFSGTKWLMTLKLGMQDRVLDCYQSKKISNDQEPTQSDPTSCPQNQKGNN